MFIRREGEELNDLLFYALSSAKMLVLQLHHLNNYLFNIGDIAIGTGQGQDVPYSTEQCRVFLAVHFRSSTMHVVHTVSFKNKFPYNTLEKSVLEVSCSTFLEAVQWFYTVQFIHGTLLQYSVFNSVHLQKQYSGFMQYMFLKNSMVGFQ